jgi:hypothetical protein
LRFLNHPISDPLGQTGISAFVFTDSHLCELERIHLVDQSPKFEDASFEILVTATWNLSDTHWTGEKFEK